MTRYRTPEPRTAEPGTPERTPEPRNPGTLEPDTVISPITVLAAVIERNGRVLVSRRLEGTHLAGLWEFPGGKCGPTEAHVSCLERELVEELGVQSVVGEELVVTEHAYPERSVRLHFRRCEIVGEPSALLNQELRWVTLAELASLDLPAGDRDVIELLTRPR